MTIQTVLGEINPDDLGVTLMHEHLCQRSSDNPGLSYKISETWLRRLKNAGCRTLCEVTPISPYGEVKMPMDPNPLSIEDQLKAYQELSKESRINVLVSTGYYTPDKAPIENVDAKFIASRIVKVIKEGIGDTGIRPAIIKVGSHKVPLSQMERKVFAAAGMAQAETGLPICTHACTGSRDQLEILLENGADPNHCYFSHVEAEFGLEGRSLKEEIAYLTNIAKKGGTLLFNNFGFEHDTPWEDLVAILRSLVEAGYENKIHICMDANFHIDREGSVRLEADAKNPECRRRDYSYIFKYSLPLLRQEGFTEENFKMFFVDVPKMVLTPFQPKKKRTAGRARKA